jgi:plasmid stability protein
LADRNSPRQYSKNKLFAINDCSAIIDCMASITIRKLPENTKRRLRLRAARNGRSMEQEARSILDHALQQPDGPAENLAVAIHKRFAALGGVDLKIPKREAMPEDRVRRLFR